MRWQTAISSHSTSHPEEIAAKQPSRALSRRRILVKIAKTSHLRQNFEKAGLTKPAFCGMIVLPLCGGVFFVPLLSGTLPVRSVVLAPPRGIAPQLQREANLFRVSSLLLMRSSGKFDTGGADNACENHPCLHRMQAPELRFQEEQEERPRQNRNEEALQILQQAHHPQGNQISKQLKPLPADIRSRISITG